ncbi:MAG: YncE family protein, partial [Nitrososphaeraceae archaeon]
MKFKFGVFSVLAYSVLMLFIPASSISNAQEYGNDEYYDNNIDDYINDKYSYFPSYTDNSDYYYYIDPKVQECEDCFFSELVKLDRKISDKILYLIDEKFGSLVELCKLIAAEKIDREDLKKILEKILDSHEFVDKNKVQKFFKDYETRSSVNYNLDEFKLKDERIDSKSLEEFKENVLDCIFSLLSVTKNWFVCDNNNMNCIMDTFNKQSLEPTFEDPTSIFYSECTSEEDCPFTSNTGIEIEISGNNPIPTNIDALVGTTADININDGPYSVSEILTGEQEPFILKFDRLDVGNIPIGIAYAQDKMLMYVANTDDGTVTILDTAGGGDNMVGNADDVVGTINVGNAPRSIAYTQDK